MFRAVHSQHNDRNNKELIFFGEVTNILHHVWNQTLDSVKQNLSQWLVGCI